VYSSRPSDDSGTAAPAGVGMNTSSSRFIVWRWLNGSRSVMSYSSSSARRRLLSIP